MTVQTDFWYLAHLKPGGLTRARTNLGRQDFPTFMPSRPKTERRAGKLYSVDRPVFPGYLFVRITPDREEWRQINSTLGVSRLVSLNKERPTRVPDDLMAQIFAQCDGETWHTHAQELSPGQSARIIQGPFSHMIATIETLPDRDRVFVLLDLMGRSTRVGVSLDDLEPL